MKPSPLTKTIHLGTVRSFAVLSDIHLREPHEPHAALTNNLLKSLTQYELVFFLGDIFDFIFARSPYFQNRWAAFFRACEYLQAHNTRVAFVEGNHDFGFEHSSPRAISSAFSWHGDFSITLNHPALGTVMLRHGDDIVCPDNYHAFRQLVKSETFQNTASLIPGQAMQHIFSRWAKISRSQSSYKKLSPDFFSRCIEARSKHFNPKPDLLVLGHVHANIDSRIHGIRCVAGPSWLESPNVLICDASGQLNRKFITGKDVPLFHVPHTE